METWTEQQFLEHIKQNSFESGNYCYSLMIVVAAMYKKMYGKMPFSVGLSGDMAENADSIVDVLPDIIKE